MEIFKIVKDNKKSLRERSRIVEEPFNDEEKALLKDMIEYLKNSQDDLWAKTNNVRSGVGLAAPQIGINKDMIAIYYVDENNRVHSYGFINPKVISESVRMCYLESGEGCLSVDKEHPGYVYRPNKIVLKAFNVVSDKYEERVFTGYEAIVVQHELDHLKGILFYDHINKEDPFYKINDAIPL